MFTAIGGLLTLPLVANMQDRLGSAKCLLFGNILLAGLMPVLGVGGVGLPLLYPTCFCVGTGLAFSDMAMNAQGVAVEKEYNLNYMGTFQAMLSFGSFAGVIFGGAMAYLGLVPLYNFFLLTMLSVPITCHCYRYLTPNNQEKMLHAQDCNDDSVGVEMVPGCSDDKAGFTVADDQNLITVSINANKKTLSQSTRNMILYLCVTGFCAQIGEGTITDWLELIVITPEIVNASPLML